MLTHFQISVNGQLIPTIYECMSKLEKFSKAIGRHSTYASLLSKYTGWVVVLPKDSGVVRVATVAR